MSIHFIDAAKMLDLPASHKLVMMAFADSADKDTRIAWPGIDGVRQWSGLKKSRAQEVVADLVERGLLVRLSGSSPGHRAEFLVLPMHTCPQCKPITISVNRSDVPDPSLRTNRSDVPDLNRSDLAANRSDLRAEQVRRTGPLPSVPPSVTPPSESTEDQKGHNLVSEARRNAGKPLGPAWSIDRTTKVLEQSLGAVPGATRTEAWKALAVVAADAAAESPGLLLHRLSALQAQVRRREAEAQRQANRNRERAEVASARGRAVPGSQVPAWQEARAQLCGVATRADSNLTDDTEEPAA